MPGGKPVSPEAIYLGLRAYERTKNLPNLQNFVSYLGCYPGFSYETNHSTKGVGNSLTLLAFIGQDLPFGSRVAAPLGNQVLEDGEKFPA